LCHALLLLLCAFPGASQQYAALHRAGAPTSGEVGSLSLNVHCLHAAVKLVAGAWGVTVDQAAVAIGGEQAPAPLDLFIGLLTLFQTEGGVTGPVLALVLGPRVLCHAHHSIIML
jgi:hypothetical protein